MSRESRNLIIAYLEILRDIQDPCDVGLFLLVELAESVGQVCWVDLPYSHEDQLVVGMAGQKHGKKFPRVFRENFIPWQILKTVS